MEQPELAAKYQKVKHWLESFDDDAAILQYEVNEETITVLSNMCDQNKEMNQLAKLLVTDLGIKCDEYQMASSCMREILEGVGLPTYALSNAGKTSLKMCSQLASALNIKDVKKSTYMMALNDFSKELPSVTEELSTKQTQMNCEVSQA